MIVLIDADIVAHRCGWASENDDVAIALARTDDMMRRILHDTNAETYRSFISGSDNFRYFINPNYKINRLDKPRPRHLAAIQEHLLTEWKSEICNRHEADDALGIAQTSNNSLGIPSVICSIDKDLHQIPGDHYNFVKEEWKHVSPLDGTRFFYKQMLIGDAVDNIIGVDRIGKVTADKLLNGIDDPVYMCELVRDKYNDDERFMMNAHCLYILTKQDTPWEPPYEFLDWDPDEET